MSVVLIVDKPLSSLARHFYLEGLKEDTKVLIAPKLNRATHIKEWLDTNLSKLNIHMCAIAAISRYATKQGIQPGYVLDTDYGAWVTIPNISTRFYDPEKVDDVLARCKAALNSYIDGSYTAPGSSLIKSATYLYPNDLEAIKSSLESLHGYPYLSCDIETYSLKHYSAGIGSIAFAWNQSEGVAIHVNNNPEVINLLRDFFIQYEGTLKWHNCLTGDHEVKTKNGWVRLDTLDNNTEILQFDPVTSRASFVKPLAIIRKDYSGEVIEWDTEFHSGIYTPNHRFVYATPANEKWRIALAQDVAEFSQNNVYIPSAFIIEGNTNALLYSDDQLRLIEAVRADASIQNTTIAFKLKKARKINRLVQLLQNTNTPFSLINYGKVTRINILKCPLKQFILEFLGENKEYPLTVLDLPLEQRVVLVEETRYWDGHTPKDSKMSWIVSSHKSNEIRFIEDLARSSGYTVRVHFYDKANCRGFSSANSKLSQILIRRKSRIKLISKPLKKYFEGMVYCVTVPTGAFVTRRCNNVWVTGNCAFDVTVLIYVLFMKSLLDQKGLLNGLEVMLRNWDCTQLITYLATNSCSGNHLSLKYQAQEFAGNYAVDGIEDIEKIPVDKLLEYNLIDTLSTNYVYEKHWSTLVTDEQLDTYTNIFKPATKDIIQMQLTGAPINIETVKEVAVKLADIEHELLSKIAGSNVTKSFEVLLNMEWVEQKNSTLKIKKVTIEDAKEVFNPNSSTQLGKLISWLQLPVLKTTPTKTTKVGRAELEQYKGIVTEPDLKELFGWLVELKGVVKINTSFIPALLDAVPAEDDWHYIFSNFRLGGTLSGRLSSNNINLQQIPNNSSYGKLIKSCFQAPPGKVLIGLDFNALEARIDALVTRDPNKLKVYLEGYDSHCLNAYAYFKDQMPDITTGDSNDKFYKVHTKLGTVLIRGQDQVTYEGREFTGEELYNFLTNKGI